MTAKQYLTISDASRLLGVSISTLRRYDNLGKLTAGRTNGGQRRYAVADLLALKTNGLNGNTTVLPIAEAAASLGVSAHGQKVGKRK